MNAITLIPGTSDLGFGTRPEPSVSAPDEIKLRVLQVGICGTDREEAAGGRALAPDGSEDLVLGHEIFGEVVEVGEHVRGLRCGDYASFTVRRECGKCMPCSIGRSDFCLTGDYRERGIWGLDGYQTEYVIDKEEYSVRIPPELKEVGVLCEPLSVAEKAIHESKRIQIARLPNAAVKPDWFFGCRSLVAGLGPIGLLAALLLRLKRANVFGLDIVDSNNARARWFEHIGGHYIDGRKVPPEKVAEELGQMDMIVEAAGVPRLAFVLLDALAESGIYVLTGVPGGDTPIRIPGPELIRRLVLNNQVMLGSVNAARGHFEMAVEDLAIARLRWGEHINALITHRYQATEYEYALHERNPDEIKAVVQWSG